MTVIAVTTNCIIEKKRPNCKLQWRYSLLVNRMTELLSQTKKYMLKYVSISLCSEISTFYTYRTTV